MSLCELEAAVESLAELRAASEADGRGTLASVVEQARQRMADTAVATAARHAPDLTAEHLHLIRHLIEFVDG